MTESSDADGSLSVSAILTRSATLFALQFGMAIGSAFIATAIVFGLVGSYSLLTRLFIALVPLGAALFIAVSSLRGKASVRIDITGLGEIRLRPAAEALSPYSVHTRNAAPLSQLCEGSLLSASLLVLRLKQPCGHINTIVIFPDSVSTEAFRRLSVACRWIAARHVSSTLRNL